MTFPWSSKRTESAPGPKESHPEVEHHRDVQGGAARAAVFGISDGLVTNASLILGMAGAAVDPQIVRIAGLAGLLAGAFSMAAGEFISMSAQSELMQRELNVERNAQLTDPEGEIRELAAIYTSRGVDSDAADAMARQIMRNPEIALEVHAREEMGIDPAQLGSPPGAAGSSFVAFAVGALIPLLPWFVASGTAAVATSILLASLSAVGIGVVIGLMTGRSIWFTSARQLVIGAAAGAMTYGVGILLGVQVG